MQFDANQEMDHFDTFAYRISVLLTPIFDTYFWKMTDTNGRQSTNWQEHKRKQNEHYEDNEETMAHGDGQQLGNVSDRNDSYVHSLISNQLSTNSTNWQNYE